MTSDNGMAASNIIWNDVTAIYMAWNDNWGNHCVVSTFGPAGNP